jgi:TolB-like protein
LQFGQYRLKRAERQLLGPGGPVELSARSFDILALLLGKPDKVIGKSEIFDAVWPGLVVEENTLQVHMSALRKTLDAGMITTVHGRGYKYAGPQPVADTSLSVKPASPVFDRKPMVVVLPFVNLSGDPDQLFFSDGITEDIIDRLSKYRALQVINYQSSMAFRGKPGEVLETRDTLAADYILTGSIRKSDQRIRISARLTEARTESAIWADHYDRQSQDILAIQDDVASIIASTLSGRIEIHVATRSPSANSGGISTYEHILQGVWHFKKLTAAENAIAAKFFAKAISISPENAEAHRLLACTRSSAWLFDLVREDIETGRRVARRAVELDPANARCHAALGFCQLWTDGLQAAVKSYRKALALNPDDPDVVIEVALCMVYAGNLAASLVR